MKVRKSKYLPTSFQLCLSKNFSAPWKAVFKRAIHENVEMCQQSVNTVKKLNFRSSCMDANKIDLNDSLTMSRQRSRNARTIKGYLWMFLLLNLAGRCGIRLTYFINRANRFRVLLCISYHPLNVSFCCAPNLHCVKSVRLWSYSGPNAENKDQNNSEYGHFSRSATHYIKVNCQINHLAIIYFTNY